jgi:cytochrome P450
MMVDFRTMMLAGHETTASSMNWILMELAKNPEYQTLVREEIRRLRREVIARGDDDFTMTDLENMPYMTAAIKVLSENSDGVMCN